MNNSCSRLFDSSLFENDATYIIGCSGGPDSTFLLKQLLNLDLSLRLIVAHVNYHKRLTSNRDRDIIRDLCLKNNVLFCEKNITAAFYKQHAKNNFQALARHARFDYFCELAAKFEARGVVLGHQLNDAIETFIIQKERKGQVNFWGLAPVNSYIYSGAKVAVLRPLLRIKKSEILVYLNKNKIAYGIDETNLKPVYQRNALRLNLNEADFAKYQQAIDIANQELKRDIKSAQGAIVNNIIDLKKYQKLTLPQQKRCIYSLLKQNCARDLINKRSQVISEIVKQFTTSQKREFVFNKNIYLKKSDDKIEVVLK